MLKLLASSSDSGKNVDVGLIVAIVLGIALIVTLVVFIIYTINLKKGVSFLYTIVGSEADTTIDSAIEKNETAKKDMKKGVVTDYNKQRKEIAKEYDKKIKEINAGYAKQVKETRKQANAAIKVAKEDEDAEGLTQIREKLDIDVRNINASKRAEVDPVVTEKNAKLKEIEDQYKPSLITYQRVLAVSRHTKPVAKILKKCKEKEYALPDYDKQ